MRTVDPFEWDLTGMLDQRRMVRLLNAPSAEEILARVAQEAMEAAATRRASLTWQPGILMQSCSRGIAVIPIAQNTFDALFNGRSGYRAQYYLSCPEGMAFNRMLATALLEPARLIHEHADLQQAWPVVRQSLGGPWSKIWISSDSAAFRDAPHGELCPRRWAERDPGHIALCAPLPKTTAIDFKGTWISDADHTPQQDPLKSDRDCRLYERGHV